MSNAATSPKPNQSVWRAMFHEPGSRAFTRWVAIINFWIFVSCLSLALETVEPYATVNAGWFRAIELIAVSFFTIDYLSNLYFAKNRVKYFFSFWGLVDLISIIPTFLMILNLTALQGAKVFRLMRVVRVLRVLKMAKMAVQNLSISVKSSNPIVTNLRIYFIALFSVMMISSTLMYFVEGGLYTAEALAQGQAALDAHILANPLPQDAPPEASKYLPVDPVSGNPIPEDKRFYTSIPAAMWWCITTLTTTGYGDMFPLSFWGRVIGGVTMLMGLVLFGILMNIVGKTIMVVLFGEHLEDAASASGGKASRDNVVHMMAELKLIDKAQANHLLQLGAQEFNERVQRTVA
jgi:voltage-gated potassium channel